MMKQFVNILIVFILFYNTKTKAQNLVPNPSFERADESLPCPRPDSLFGFNPTSEAIPWIELASADYFHTCATLYYVSVPENRFGFQHPHYGQGYVGIATYASTDPLVREYVEVELLSPLLFGQTYYVQFYASLADTMRYAVSNLGALFTDTLWNPISGPFPTGHPQAWYPQIENSTSNVLNDKINWVPINGSFVANGGERYITIGNFRADAQTITQYVGGNLHPNTRGAYYYIDDVYVGTTPPVSINENEKNNFNFKLYPNPNNGNMTLEYNPINDADVEIRDVLGKLVYVNKLDSNNSKINITENVLKEGVYFYTIKNNDTILFNDKFIIIK